MRPMWDDSPSPLPNFQAKHKKLQKITSSQIHSPLLRDEVDYGIGLSFRYASLWAWRAGTATLSQLYLSSQELWIGPQ
jgi:hypothetical protein